MGPLFLNLDAGRRRVVHIRSQPLYPGKGPRNVCDRRLGGSQSRFRPLGENKILLGPPGFKLLSFHPVA
jgi:hypothetical protein